MARQRTLDNMGQEQDPGGVLRSVNPADVLGAGQQESGGFTTPGDNQGQVQVPDSFHPQVGQGQETPHDRGQVGGQSGVGGNATLRRPTAPTPQAGSTMTAGASMRPPLMPFTPMGDTSTSSLLGGAGGLKGGGLGVPMTPHPGAQNQDISGLIQMLMSKFKGGL